jgi:hypothetical protein
LDEILQSPEDTPKNATKKKLDEKETCDVSYLCILVIIF